MDHKPLNIITVVCWLCIVVLLLTGTARASTTTPAGRVLLHCAPNTNQQVDPLAHFGEPLSPHMHTPAGADVFSDVTTPDEMLTGPTSCLIQSDHDLLWIPTPLKPDGTPATILNFSYYVMNRGYNITQDPPNGLRFLAGNPDYVGVLGAGEFICLSTGRSTHTIPTAGKCPATVSGQGYELVLLSPGQCWYPNGGLGVGMGDIGYDAIITRDAPGVCESLGGQAIPRIDLAVSVGADGLGGSLSSDTSPSTPGSSAHYDFVFGFVPNAQGDNTIGLIDSECLDQTGYGANQSTCTEVSNANHLQEAIYLLDSQSPQHILGFVTN